MATNVIVRLKGPPHGSHTHAAPKRDGQTNFSPALEAAVDKEIDTGDE